MRLLIVSDIHSNFAALQAVEKDAGEVDAVAFAGDAVDYGPRPAECIAWLRQHATWAVRGNHDEALANNTSCRCSEAFRELSVATRAMNQERVSHADRRYLAALPLTALFDFGGKRFGMIHAAPIDPMYRYLPLGLSNNELRVEMENLPNMADVIILGHTHLPFVRRLSNSQVVNPGSVGRPKHGDTRAAYAIWEDGVITLHRVAYPVEQTMQELQATNLDAKVLVGLSYILCTGDVPGKTVPP
jgi:putative phosphoesterase